MYPTSPIKVPHPAPRALPSASSRTEGGGVGVACRQGVGLESNNASRGPVAAALRYYPGVPRTFPYGVLKPVDESLAPLE